MATTILQAGPNTPIATPDDVEAVAADLRYRIAEAETSAKLPNDVEYVIVGGTTYQVADLSLFKSFGWYLQNGDVDLGCWWPESGDGSGAANQGNVEFYSDGGQQLSDVPNLIVFRLLADRTVNLITADDETSIDIELPAAVEEPTGVRRARDFILDVDNYANESDLALEFTGLDVDYAFVPIDGDDIAEMTTIGAGERARFYFTETPYIDLSLPVLQVARVTLGEFVHVITPATEGGN